jgi:hypothetical protein
MTNVLTQPAFHMMRFWEFDRIALDAGGMLRLEPAGVDLRAVDAPQAFVAGMLMLLVVLLVRRRH